MGKCPVCKNREHIEVDTHSDGWCTDHKICGVCGSEWCFKKGELSIIKENNVEE